MNTKLIISIAKSLLLARWKQTLVAAIGVTFSITMFTTLLSFMSGLNDMLDGLILNRTPHVRLYNEISPSKNQPIAKSKDYQHSYNFIHSIKSGNSREEIYNSGAIMKTLDKDDRVIGYAPKIITQVFFNDGSIDITGVINGIDVEKESRLFHFGDYITSGSGIDISRVPNSIVIGKGLAEKLLADIGDMVQVTTAKGERFSLKVVGYFQSGIREYSRLFQADAEDIQTANSQFETGSSIRTLISYTVGITLLIVAGFGIYNILNMMIYEKMDSIAILKATGFAGKDVKKIFIYIALSIGFFGGLLGLILGFCLTSLIGHIPFNTPSLPTVKTYPVKFNSIFYLIGVLFSLVTTYLAGWFPARKASKVDPVIIIRGK